jgi:hypothetical protein
MQTACQAGDRASASSSQSKPGECLRGRLWQLPGTGCLSSTPSAPAADCGAGYSVPHNCTLLADRTTEQLPLPGRQSSWLHRTIISSTWMPTAPGWWTHSACTTSTPGWVPWGTGGGATASRKSGCAWRQGGCGEAVRHVAVLRHHLITRQHRWHRSQCISNLVTPPSPSLLPARAAPPRPPCSVTLAGPSKHLNAW